MNNREIASRYAQALSKLEASKEAMLSFSQILDQIAFLEKKLKPFHDFLISPFIAKKEKKNFFLNCFKNHLEPLLLNFLFVLIDKSKISLLSEIAARYKELAYEANGIVEVIVESAQPLKEKAQIELKNRLEKFFGQSILIREKITPEILGGIILSVKNTTLDYSIKDRLSKLKMFTLNY